MTATLRDEDDETLCCICGLRIGERVAYVNLNSTAWIYMEKYSKSHVECYTYLSCIKESLKNESNNNNKKTV